MALIELWGNALAQAKFSPYRPTEEVDDPVEAQSAEKEAQETFARVLAWRAHMAAHSIAGAQAAPAAPGGQVSEGEVVQG
jgi:hypothetical protein